MASLLMTSFGVTRRRTELAFFCLLTTVMTLFTSNITESATASGDRVVDDSQLRSLERSLASQPDEVKARYPARNPAGTLLFFGIKPGDTVVETDPGSGWYSRILQSYLGAKGHLIGADYPLGLYPLFDYYSDEELLAKASWGEQWPAQFLEEGASVSGYNLGTLPADLTNSVDCFLFIRSLHNLVDFEAEGGFLTDSLNEALRVLKPGGVLGVVQHMGPETHSDEWASGANGYLKLSFVIDTVQAAGFVLEASSDINLNPKDRPSGDEYVWRLMPTLEPAESEAVLRSYRAIGESNRMTLRFRKPVSQ